MQSTAATHASESIGKRVEPVEPVIEPVQKCVEPVEPAIRRKVWNVDLILIYNTRRSYWFYGILCRFYDGAAQVLLVLLVSLYRARALTT